MRISFKQHLAEPPKQVKGLVARTYLYMCDKYNVSLTPEQQALDRKWNKDYPSSAWEKKRAEAIKKYMGLNPYY